MSRYKHFANNPSLVVLEITLFISLEIVPFVCKYQLKPTLYCVFMCVLVFYY